MPGGRSRASRTCDYEPHRGTPHLAPPAGSSPETPLDEQGKSLLAELRYVVNIEIHIVVTGLPRGRRTSNLMHCTWAHVKMTRMKQIKAYLLKGELDALRKAAAGSARSVAELVRDAVRKVVRKPQAAGPVAIWDGEPKRASFDHNSVHDQP